MTARDPDIRTIPPDGNCGAEQPDWRREFPIDVPQDNYVARRDFTKFLGLTSLAFAVGQFWIGIQSWLRHREPAPEARKIAALDQVPVGAAIAFTYPDPSEPCLLLRPSADTLVAFNQKCTHLSCAVVSKMSEGHLHCPCHHGVFDMASGRPIAGPPRRPLSRIVLEIRGSDIYAVGVELRTV